MNTKDKMIKEMSRKARNFIASASAEDLEDIYRFVQFYYVKTDVENYCDVRDIMLDEEDISQIAYRLVCKKQQETTLDYWENLECYCDDAEDEKEEC